jgi:hypothetical protein
VRLVRKLLSIIARKPAPMTDAFERAIALKRQWSCAVAGCAFDGRHWVEEEDAVFLSRAGTVELR